MRETTDTSSQYELLPEARYKMTVAGRPVKKRTGETTYREWKFKVAFDGRMKEIKVFLFPWESKELLLCLGGKEVSTNKIDWEDDSVEGLVISANLKHFEYKDRVSGEMKKKYMLDHIEEEIPFGD